MGDEDEKTGTRTIKKEATGGANVTPTTDGTATGGYVDDVGDLDKDKDNGNGDGNGTYIYYGGGGGGSGSAKTPEELQEEMQAQIWNTQANYAKRRGDMDQMSKDSLNNILGQIDMNNKLLEQQNARNMRSVQWQPNEQAKQSTQMTLQNRMGNSLYGAGLTDLLQGMSRIDDKMDFSLIDAYRQTADNDYNNWLQADTQLVSDYNDQVTSLADEYSKLYSQYWSAMSNLNPLLATEENMAKANAYGKPESEWEYPTVGEDTDRYSMNPIILEPDEELKNMMKQRVYSSAVNPLTNGYVRPDKGQVSYGGTRGTHGRTAANKAFYDNILAYSKPINR